MAGNDLLTFIIRLQLEVTGNGDTEQHPEEGGFLFDGPDAITVKEAQAILNASRETIDGMRRNGQLTTYLRNRQVRLDRKEVENARKWWSVPKGKV